MATGTIVPLESESQSADEYRLLRVRDLIYVVAGALGLLVVPSAPSQADPDANRGISALLTIPGAAWELSLGIYLIVKGFKTSSPLIDTRQRGASQASLPTPAVATP